MPLRVMWRGAAKCSYNAEKPACREHCNEVTAVAGKGAGYLLGAESLAFISAKVFPPPLLASDCHPLAHTPNLTLSDCAGTPSWRALVRVSCVVLSETIRIVSKLTHTTNVGEPCYSALGCASCCLRGRGRRRRVHPGPLEGRGLGGAGPPPRRRAPPIFPSFPSGPQ